MEKSTLKAILLKYRLFSDFFTASSLEQFKRYLATGFFSFGIEYLLFIVLYKILLMEPIPANIIVYASVFWINFLLNRVWSFRSQSSFFRQLKLYFLLFIFNLLIANVFLMYFISHVIGISPLLSKGIVMGFVVSWNFILYKKVIYK